MRACKSILYGQIYLAKMFNCKYQSIFYVISEQTSLVFVTVTAQNPDLDPVC